MLVHRIPYPPDKGDKIRSYNELKFLARQGWKIHLCTFSEEPVKASHVRALEELCETCRIFPLGGLRRKAALAKALFQGKPLSVAAFYSSSAQRHVEKVLAEYPVQAVLCFCAPMAEYVFQAQLTNSRPRDHDNPSSRNQTVSGGKSLSPRQSEVADQLAAPAATQRGRQSSKNPVIVMDLVDVDSEKWALYAQNHAGFKSLIYRLENKRLRLYEDTILSSFPATAVVSEAEADQLRSRSHEPDKIRAMGNGVDLGYYSLAQDLENSSQSLRECRLVFCGQMDYFPNIDAVTWFVHEVLPELKELIRQVRFHVVGARPVQNVRRLSSIEGVEVTGRVEDVRPYIQHMDISVAPIRVARGIQNKVLEAMAMGKPVVATDQAFEGIAAKPGRDLLVARAHPKEFAAAVAGVWKDPSKAGTLGQSARERMERDYSWEAQLAPLRELMRDGDLWNRGAAPDRDMESGHQ